MGYDVEFIQIAAADGLPFPVPDAEAKKLLKKPAAFKDTAEVRELLLKLPGTKAGQGDAVDYVGQGLNYAKFTVKKDRIHVENNCGPKELLKIHGHLAAQLPNLFILDVQSGQLHTAKSLQEWWARPL